MAKLSAMQVEVLKQILASSSEDLGPDTRYISCKGGTRLPLKSFDPSYKPRLIRGSGKSVILSDLIVGLMAGDIKVPDEMRIDQDSV